MANYLYNGVELPQLPEWDKETFPCAMILRKTDGTYHLRLFRGTSGWGIDNNYPKLFLTDDPDEFEVTYKPVALTENGWGDATGTGGYNTSAFQIGEKGATTPTWQVWSNVDIVHKDTGELLLAASDPIPVNPAPTLDPTSLLMGWQVGNRIRQRTKGATE